MLSKVILQIIAIGLSFVIFIFIILEILQDYMFIIWENLNIGL